MNGTVAPHLCSHPGLLFGLFSLFASLLLFSAILSNILLLLAIRKVNFNRNARFCMTNIIVSLLFYSFPVFNRYLMGIRSLWAAIPPSTNEFCALTTAPSIVFKIVILFCQGSLALDRYLELKKATKAASNHQQGAEDRSKFDNPQIINWSVGAAWVLGLLLGTRFAVDGVTSEGSFCYCIILHKFKSTLSVFLVFLLLGVTSSVLYFVVWRRSVQAKAAFNLYSVQHNLDARYALVQNIKTTEVMLPAVMAFCAIDVLSCSILSGTVLLTINVEQSLLIAFSSWWMLSIQLLLYSMACSFKSAQLRKAMKDLLRDLLSCGRAAPPAVGPGEEGQELQVVNHKVSTGTSFKLLEDIWKTGRRARQHLPPIS